MQLSLGTKVPAHQVSLTCGEPSSSSSLEYRSLSFHVKSHVIFDSVNPREESAKPKLGAKATHYFPASLNTSLPG